MSSLTDKEFLLHTLHLSYLRHVLPSHAPNSALLGHSNPYNLISFPPPASSSSTSSSANPYISLANLDDDTLHPELKSGRSSPPLEIVLGRESRDAGRRRGPGNPTAGAGGAGGLRYTQTITGKASGVVSGGMRVNAGRQRTWKGKARAEEQENGDLNEEGTSEQPPLPSLDTSAAHPPQPSSPSRRLQPAVSSSSLRHPPASVSRPIPPNVVIHSPVKTPRDATPHPFLPPAVPVSPFDLGAYGGAQASAPYQSQGAPTAPPSNEPLEAGDSRLRLDDPPDTPSSPPPAAIPPATSPAQSPAIASPAVSDSLSSSPSSSLSSSRYPSPLSHVPPSPQQQQGETIDDQGSSVQPDLDTGLGGASLASSGVSLFNPSSSEVSSARNSASASASVSVSVSGRGPLSRLTPLETRTETETSPQPPPATEEAVPPPPPMPPTQSESEPKPDTMPVSVPVQAPVFQLPPGLRVRERRRVNLRPGVGIGFIPAAPAAAMTPASPPSAGQQLQSVEVQGLKEVEEKGGRQTEPGVGGEGGKSSQLPVSPPSTATPPPSAPATHEAAPEESKTGHEAPRVTSLAFAPASGSQSNPVSRFEPQPPAPQGPPSIAAIVVPDHDTLALPPRSPVPSPSPSNALFFAPRSVYIRQSQSHPASPSHSLSTSPDPTQTRPSALSARLRAPPSNSSSSSMLGEAGGAALATNPFSRLYSLCVSRSEADSIPLRLHFPTFNLDTKEKKKEKKMTIKPVEVKVKKDVTVEEVIGVGFYILLGRAGEGEVVRKGLWGHDEEGEEEKEKEMEKERQEGEKRAREGRETERWELRIVEDEEGEVDEDFPALDRTRLVSAFAFNEFAIVRAGEEQIADNALKQSTLVRRPSRILASAPLPPSATPLPASSITTATGKKVAVEEEFVTLQIRLPPALAQIKGREKVEMRLEGGTKLGQVIALLLSELPPPHRFLLSPTDFALLLPLSDAELVLPLDRAVAATGGSVEGRRLDEAGREIRLVERRDVGGVGIGLRQAQQPHFQGGGMGRMREDGQPLGSSPLVDSTTTTGNPRPGAHRTISDTQLPPPPGLGPPSNHLAAPYVQYHVLRKLPMSLGGRHPRVIAIDGDYLHFMPPDPRLANPLHPPHQAAAVAHPLHPPHQAAAVAHPLLNFDSPSGRTTSYHISAIHTCKLSRRSPQLKNSFKIVVHTKRNVDKRYDFEAENGEVAQEIVERVEGVMRDYGAGEQGRTQRLIVKKRKGKGR